MVIAARDIPVGHTLSSSDVALVEGFLSAEALAPSSDIGDVVGSFTTRPLSRGEVLTPAVVTSRPDARLTTLVLTLAEPVPQALKTGATIEIWSTGHRADSSGFVAEQTPGKPVALVAGEYVGPATSPDQISVDTTPRAEIILAKSDVATILAAQAAADDLIILPAWTTR